MASLTHPDPPAPPASSTRLGPRAAGPLLAALVVFAGAAPGLLAMPVLDRDEARFIQSTAQMLESGDIVDPRFQDASRDKKPVGTNWVQAAAVRLTSSAQARAVWAYRLPSLLAGMAAAAAAAWGAQAFFRPWRAAAAGVALGGGALLSSEAFVAKADALLCAGVTLSLAGFAHLYAAADRGEDGRAGDRAAVWLGLALALMVKGPVGPVVLGCAMLTLWAVDRKAPWARRMSWRWGLLFLLGVAGPWTAAVTVSGDGGFWVGSLGGDIAAKLAAVREGHRGWPGFYLALAPVLMFPATALLPAAAVYGWRHRRAPAVRFSLAWLAPMWLLFELAPTRLPHYTLPLYGAVALLMAGALGHAAGRWSRWSGAALSGAAALVLATAALAAALRFGDGGSALTAAGVTAALTLAAGVAGAVGVLAGRPGADLSGRLSWLCAAVGLGVAAHVAASAWLAPALDDLWPSRAAARLVARAGLDPRNGLTPGPVAVAGYAEPSLVFRLGSDTDLLDGEGAAEALEAGRPALVEARQAQAFLARLRRDGAVARRVGEVRGLDYSDGRPVVLDLWMLRGAQSGRSDAQPSG